MIKLNNSWDAFLEDETRKEYYLKLREFLKREYATKRIYPDMNNIFAAFGAVPIEHVKVVILGQDPYHQPGQAHGMSFSVMPGVKRPPSLSNIYKEIQSDCGVAMGESGYLLPWAQQGVFLLNACLTVEDSKPGAHRNRGWELLTSEAICLLNEDPNPKVFLLWGADAKNKQCLITSKNHLVLQAAHPSPLAAHNGFFGCRHFSKANDFLVAHGRRPIDWHIE